uniref:RT02919p n=1 Tax=Drosophila melanogaster TaxID=7227 RepID=Q9VBD8_DROME|eukprot:NP_651487.1 TweedleO [Drosophila melanogaster]
MRFLIAFCLIGAACAQYNYGAGFTGAASDNVPSYSGSSVGDSYDGAASSPDYSVSSELNKEYYTFEADESQFEDPLAAQKIAGSVNKGLRVVFIKGPENRGLENAALALAKQAAEQRTAIYVLNKQTDIGDLAQKFNAARQNSNQRPEVHFVKYRTPEDAANAQRAIQSQYDNLGGSSQSINGGVANAINFASAAPVVPARRGPNYSPPAAATSNSYLPANILRRLRIR